MATASPRVPKAVPAGSFPEAPAFLDEAGLSQNGSVLVYYGAHEKEGVAYELKSIAWRLLEDVGVAIAAYNAPKSLHCLSPNQQMETFLVLEHAKRDPRVRALVWTGTGVKAALSSAFKGPTVWCAMLGPSCRLNLWNRQFKAAVESGLAPDFLVHWGHGAAMGTVLVAMGGYGTFLGWQVRFGNGAVEYPLTLGKTAKEMHPLLMGGALFLFLLGGQGGLILLATQGQPILQSAHSSTAVLGLGLMAIQASLGLTMGNAPEKRTVHAFAGTAIMVLLSVHMYFGLNLGNSF
ncbi:unnamed protein product [Polarella glacialis]|uniref:Uncharacterized protein n=1 Tax=Polarella glacialis TaxID=89957 RepID=A0A813L967_POLGL|nr:unnamed protein product [Polarella glacialis]